MNKPIAWRRATKYGTEYRTIEPSEKVRKREPGWLPLYGAPVIPEGWQIVPKEPTPRMREAAIACGRGSSKEEYYCAMLAEAPALTPNVEHNRRPQGVRVDGPVGPLVKE